jgi:hypothetical protein
MRTPLVIVVDVSSDRMAERSLAKEDELVEAFFLDRSHD